MKKPINRWMLAHIGLITFGAAVLALHFLVFTEEARERLVLAFVLIVAGCTAIVAGMLGLLIQSLMHLLAARKSGNQRPSAVGHLERSAETMKIRGGIRIDNLYETWPSAQLCFGTEGLVLRYRGEHAVKKEELKMVRFLRGTFTTEVRIKHSSNIADSPIRFFPLFPRDAYVQVRSLGLPCEEKRALFYTKGDLMGWH